MREQTISRIVKGTKILFRYVDTISGRLKKGNILLPYIEKNLKTGTNHKSLDYLRRLIMKYENREIILFTIDDIQFVKSRYIMRLSDFIMCARVVEDDNTKKKNKTTKKEKENENNE